MPYMYCQHTGCNETVKVPTQLCAKHVQEAMKVAKQAQPKAQPKAEESKTTK